MGAALSDIGRVDTKTPYELHYQAASRAIADAGLTKNDIDGLASSGTGLLSPGTVPVETSFILSGTVVLGIPTEDDGFVQVAQLGRDDAVGITALSRSQTISRAIATSEVDVVVLPVRILDEIVRAHPVVAREIVRESDNRVQQARIALHAVGEQLPFSRRVLG